MHGDANGQNSWLWINDDERYVALPTPHIACAPSCETGNIQAIIIHKVMGSLTIHTIITMDENVENQSKIPDQEVFQSLPVFQ